MWQLVGTRNTADQYGIASSQDQPKDLFPLHLQSTVKIMVTYTQRQKTEVKTVDCCCSQVDKQDWRWIHFWIPYIFYCIFTSLART